MIENIIRDFLESKLSVPVLMETPKRPDAKYVVIERTGGAQENHIPSAIITIQSYGESLYDAAALNEEVKSWMLDGMIGLVTLGSIASVDLNSDYNFTDTTTKHYRYQAVYDITHYEGGTL